MLGLFVLGTLAVFASAVVTSVDRMVNENAPEDVPNDVVFTGMACPYVWSRDCSMPPKVDKNCFPVNFGECVQMPTQNLKFYEITYYDIYRKGITFQRFTDALCRDKDPYWSHNPPSGYSGECIGPVAKIGADNIFLVITVDHEEYKVKVQ